MTGHVTLELPESGETVQLSSAVTTRTAQALRGVFDELNDPRADDVYVKDKMLEMLNEEVVQQERREAEAAAIEGVTQPAPLDWS